MTLPKVTLLAVLIAQAPVALCEINDKVCDDLFRLGCVSGSFEDGTGFARNSGPLEDSVRDLAKDFQKNIEDQFKLRLKAPDNDYFRKVALSATGLSLLSQCDNAGRPGVPAAECLDQLTKAVAEIALRDLAINEGPALGYFGGAVSYGQNTASADRMTLTQSPEYRDVRSKLIADLKQRIGMNELDKKIREKIFPEVKKLLISKIDQLVPNQETRDAMISKIRAIRYDGSNCGRDLPENKESIPGLLISNAVYDRNTSTFKYCAGFALSNTSEFQMAYVIAHELAHSIDPCGIEIGPSDFSFKYRSRTDRRAMESEFPIPGVLQCLRSEESVNAQPPNTVPGIPQGGGFGWPTEPIGPYGGPADEGASPNFDGKADAGDQPKPTSRNRRPEPKNISFCRGDQITESFPDWIATEIVPDYIATNFPKLTRNQFRAGYSNIWRGDCQDNEQGSTPLGVNALHPKTELRANRIILVNPKVRKQMGCSTKPREGVYCEAGIDNGSNMSTPVNNPTKTPKNSGATK